MDQIWHHLLSGLAGGVVTGVASFTAIRVHLFYLRRDVDHAHARIHEIEERERERMLQGS